MSRAGSGGRAFTAYEGSRRSFATQGAHLSPLASLRPPPDRAAPLLLAALFLTAFAGLGLG